MRPRTVAVVPSAGHGRRLGLKAKKPFVLLRGRPLACYALKTLDACGAIDAIVIACEKSCVKRFQDLVRRLGLRKVAAIVAGGKTRRESVRNCLERIDGSFDIVLIHDAARPFVDRRLVERSIKSAARYGACVAAVPENDTVKLTGEGLFVKRTLERDKIYRAQTPQAFRRELIKKAYASGGASQTTDDASLVELLGRPVKVIEGSYRNIKITTKEDLKIAEALL